jgi:hypothetical protein
MRTNTLLAILEILVQSESFKIALISGVFALLGSAITGFFLIQSNQIVADKDFKIKTSEVIQKNHDVLRKKSEAFILGVYDYFIVLSENPNASNSELRIATLNLQKKAMALSIYSGTALSVASRKLTHALAEFPHSKNDQSGEDVADNVAKALSNWHKEFYLETSSYNIELMPEKFVKGALLDYLRSKNG